MSDVLKLIQEADVAAIEMEKAREAIEAAKLVWEDAKHRFEVAREAFEDTLVKADELGIPKAKMKKLIEERTTALVSSGLMIKDDKSGKPAKAAKPKKAKAAKEADALDDFESHDKDDRNIVQLNA